MDYLQYYIQEFKKYISLQTTSPNTIKNYLSDLRLFFSFIGQKGSKPLSPLTLPSYISPDFITEYESYLSLANPPSTTKRRVSSLKKFIDYCQSIGIVPQMSDSAALADFPLPPSPPPVDYSNFPPIPPSAPPSSTSQIPPSPSYPYPPYSNIPQPQSAAFAPPPIPNSYPTHPIDTPPSPPVYPAYPPQPVSPPPPPAVPTFVSVSPTSAPTPPSPDRLSQTSTLPRYTSDSFSPPPPPYQNPSPSPVLPIEPPPSPVPFSPPASQPPQPSAAVHEEHPEHLVHTMESFFSDLPSSDQTETVSVSEHKNPSPSFSSETNVWTYIIISIISFVICLSITLFVTLVLMK